MSEESEPIGFSLQVDAGNSVAAIDTAIAKQQALNDTADASFTISKKMEAAIRSMNEQRTAEAAAAEKLEKQLRAVNVIFGDLAKTEEQAAEAAARFNANQQRVSEEAQKTTRALIAQAAAVKAQQAAWDAADAKLKAHVASVNAYIAAETAAAAATQRLGDALRQNQAAAGGSAGGIDPKVGQDLDEVDGKLKGVALNTRALHGLLQRLPNIGGVLGLGDVEMLIYQLSRVSSLVGGVAAFGGVGVIAGAALAAAPIIYDIATLLEIAKLNKQSADTLAGSNLGGVRTTASIIAGGRQSGEIDSNVAEKLRKENEAIAERQKLGNGDTLMERAGAWLLELSPIFANYASEELNTAIDQLAFGSDPAKNAEVEERLKVHLKKIADARHASTATIQEGELQAQEYRSKLDEAAMAEAIQVATREMEGITKTRNVTLDESVAAVNKWNAEVKAALKQQAEDEMAVLSLKYGQEAELAKKIAPNDKDALAKFQNVKDGLDAQAALIRQQLDTRIASQERASSEKLTAAENASQARLEADEKREEQIARQVEREQEQAEREEDALQAELDRLIEEIARRERRENRQAISSDWRKTDVEKFGAERANIGRDEASGEIIGQEATNRRQGQGPDPTNVDQQMQGANVKLLNQFGTTAQQIAQTYTQVIGAAVQSISGGIQGLIKGTMTWGDALRSIGTGIVDSIIKAFADMVAKWIVTHTLMAGVSAAFATTDVGIHAAAETAKTGVTATGATARGGIRVAETIFSGIQVAFSAAFHIASEVAKTAATVAGTAIRIPLIIVEAGAAVIQAAVEALAALAGIPYVGPFLAIAMAGTILALGASMVKKIGLADGGVVPGARTHRDTVPAMLTPGEVVIPERVVDAYGSDYFLSRYVKGSGSPDGIHYAQGGVVFSPTSASVGLQSVTLVDNRRGRFKATHTEAGFREAVIDVMNEQSYRFRSK